MNDTEKLVIKASEPLFYRRVMFLALSAAQDIASEDPETANHKERVQYARRIMRGEEDATMLAAHVIAANPTIRSSIIADEEPTDNDVSFVLASIWNARAFAFFEPVEPVSEA